MTTSSIIDSISLFTISCMFYIFPIKDALANNNKHAAKLHSYITSTIHAIIISLLSGIVVLGENVPHSLYFYSMGYFISDIWYLVITHKSTYIEFSKTIIMISFIIHHLVMLGYEGYVFIYNPGNTILLYFVSRMLLAEIAVIPLNVTWYFTKYNKSIYWTRISGICLAITYFLTRVVNLTLLFIDVCNSEYSHLGYFGTPVLLLNYIWFYKIIRNVIKIC